jgi:hypothetical protein
MNDRPTKRRTSPFIVWPVCLVLFVVIYVASYGPFVWFWAHEKISLETGERIDKTVYFPIWWIGENTRFFEDHPVGRAYTSYIVWWIGEVQ